MFLRDDSGAHLSAQSAPGATVKELTSTIPNKCAAPAQQSRPGFLPPLLGIPQSKTHLNPADGLEGGFFGKALQIEGPPRYLDVNFSWGKLYGISAGVIFNIEEGTVHVYAGPALAYGKAASLTASSQSVTPGWNLGLQASAFRGSVQAGLDPSGRSFMEYGWAFTGSGGSFSGVWISPPITSPASAWNPMGDLIRPWKETVFNRAASD